MQCITKRVAAGAALLAILGVAACSDRTGTTLPTEGAQSASAGAADSAAVRAAGEKLAKTMAVSLRDASVRGILHRAFSSSPVLEGKLHLGTYLRGEGKALLLAMARASGSTEAGILALVDQAGSHEFYLPVEAHRALWKGGSNVIVASQIKDHTAPIGFDAAGQRLVLSAETPPSVPVIALIPAESFDAQGNPHARGMPRGASHHGAPTYNHSTTGTMWTGLWVNYVYIPGDYEAWARGAPEYEMYLERGANRTKIRCAAEPSVEPFRWNMDGTTYDADFLVGWDQETPTLEGLLIYVYEDDDTECKVQVNKDYVKLAAEALSNAGSAWKAVGERQWEQAAVAFKHAAVAFWSIVSGSDEFVGVISVDGDVTTAPRRALIKSENAVDRGWVDLQWKTDTAH
jgi:hypothetical protein